MSLDSFRFCGSPGSGFISFHEALTAFLNSLPPWLAKDARRRLTFHYRREARSCLTDVWWTAPDRMVKRSIYAKPKGGCMVAGGDLDGIMSDVDGTRHFRDRGRLKRQKPLGTPSTEDR